MKAEQHVICFCRERKRCFVPTESQSYVELAHYSFFGHCFQRTLVFNNWFSKCPLQMIDPFFTLLCPTQHLKRLISMDYIIGVPLSLASSWIKPVGGPGRRERRKGREVKYSFPAHAHCTPF